MNCCENKNIVNDTEIGEYCNNCYSISESIIFEDRSFEFAEPKVRVRRFRELLYRAELPWYVVQTLSDMFPTIEHHFDTCSRKNFIHMEQLIIELLIIGRFNEYTDRFKGLKTRSNALGVRQFVKDAFGEPISLGLPLPRMDELPYFTTTVGYIDDSKRYKDDHIFKNQ